MKYNWNILFLKENFLKGVKLMTNAELILKLVEMLLESEKKQVAKTADVQEYQARD